MLSDGVTKARCIARTALLATDREGLLYGFQDFAVGVLTFKVFRIWGLQMTG